MNKSEITGLVLAGGRGSRMGGVDKGLQNFRGMPLALHTLLRLSPQVGEVMVNASGLCSKAAENFNSEARDVAALFDFPLIAYPPPSPSVDVRNNVYTQATIRLCAVL